ncbi:hypothetical protein [Streptomyces mayteni]
MADTLEAHITVSCPPDEVSRLAAWAAGRRLGFTHIELARGRARSQPMVNVRGGDAVAETVRDLAADGFGVVRALSGRENLGPEAALRAVVAGNEDAWTFLRARPEPRARVLAMVADDEGPADGTGS